MNQFIRIAGQVGVTIWLLFMGSIGTSVAYGCSGIIGALGMVVFMLIAGGFLEGIIYCALRNSFAPAASKPEAAAKRAEQ